MFDLLEMKMMWLWLCVSMLGSVVWVRCMLFIMLILNRCC